LIDVHYAESPSPTKDNSSTTSKTRSITFRLDSSVIDEIQREADQKETSLNVLVNQVLKRYTEWDRYESKIGMMPVPKLINL
jgi:predicted HicB family RNase H-like nuclease